MAARVCLVHYHEVGLKGKNRAHFEHILMDNIRAALAAFSVNAVSRISGYILVTFNEHQADEAARVIRTGFPALLVCLWRITPIATLRSTVPPP